MRTVRYCAVVLTLFAASGCSRSADPLPLAGETASQAPATSQSKPTGSAAPLDGLAAALGRRRSLPVPEGLVPGGDCPPPPPDAAEEIAAQADAAIPLTEGLTFTYMWMRTPQEEHECLMQVRKIDATGIVTSASCDSAEGGQFLRRVCRADLRSASMLHTLYGAVKVIGASGEEEPETITGATAFSLSLAEFAQLKRTGAFTHRYVELESADKLAKDGVGELRIEGRDTMKVIVNDRIVDVPVIRTRGGMKWWIRGERLETEDTAVILDDDRFPLLIDQKSSSEKAGSRIQFAKITYPSEARRAPGGPLKMRGGSLEEGLVDNNRVDVYGIYFDFNSDRVRPESEPVLEEIASIMKRHPEWRLSIQGHTDNIGGNSQYNLELSQRRSAAVVSALVNRFAISAERLTSGGSGAASPRDTNDTPEGRARNRRVELVRQ